MDVKIMMMMYCYEYSEYACIFEFVSMICRSAGGSYDL